MTEPQTMTSERIAERIAEMIGRCLCNGSECDACDYGPLQNCWCVRAPAEGSAYCRPCAPWQTARASAARGSGERVGR